VVDERRVIGTATTLDRDGLLRLAEEVVERSQAAGATEAEVLASVDRSALTRFANSEIHQNVAEHRVGLNLRFIVGRRVAVASTDRTDDEGIRSLVDSAAAIARVVERLDDWGGLPKPTPVTEVAGSASSGTSGATPEFRSEGARAVIGAADDAGVVAYGSYSTTTETLAIATTTGIRVAEDRTNAQLLTVMMGPDGGTGYAEANAVDATAIDAAAVGREAAAKARASANPIEVPAGDYPVVLEEYAVVDIMDMLGMLGFSALAVQEGRSFVARGRRIGSPLVSIWDDGHDPAGLPMGFDYEGVAKQRVPLVERGLCAEVVYDAQTAARDDRASTGHGLPAPNPWGPFPLNMQMAAGTASRDDLIGGMERGLLVTRFHYTNPVHPKLAIITGMTRDGTFLVEGGEIVGPVRNLRFTQSYLEALAATSAVGRDRKLVRGLLGAALVPAVRIDAFTFTGTTQH
jgi:PmbA protein